MSRASLFERQMLTLINQERAKAGLDPLKLNILLNDSSEDHSQWMIDTDNFSHTGKGGSSAGDRMESADYPFEGSWSWGENLALQSERGAAGIADDVVQLHQSLMDSPGHRANILNGGFTEIGIGIERGEYEGFDAVVVTQNFARTDGDTSLTVEPFPTPMPDPVPSPPAPTPTPDALALTGTQGNDVLRGGQGNDTISGNAGFDRLIGASGNDRMHGGAQGDNLQGGVGNDTMLGGVGSDRLNGGSGNDVAFGGAQGDVLLGGSGSDRLNGQAGNDRVFGGHNNDVLMGGAGNDSLFGGGGIDILRSDTGNDQMTGNFGADRFVFADRSGGFGHDTITDFAVGIRLEKIDLSRVSAVSNQTDLFANHIRQVGSDVRIDVGGGSSITLRNVNQRDLDEFDFIF